MELKEEYRIGTKVMVPGGYYLLDDTGWKWLCNTGKMHSLHYKYPQVEPGLYSIIQPPAETNEEPKLVKDKDLEGYVNKLGRSFDRPMILKGEDHKIIRPTIPEKNGKGGDFTMTPEQIDNMFTYHRPEGDQAERYDKITEAARQFAHTINNLCPESAEKTKAIRKVQAARMWANASIAINEN